jgi:hypothetical protein
MPYACPLSKIAVNKTDQRTVTQLRLIDSIIPMTKKYRYAAQEGTAIATPSQILLRLQRGIALIQFIGQRTHQEIYFICTYLSNSLKL